MLARKIIESLNVSPIYFIVAFNLSQNLSLIAGICIYDCKPIHLQVQPPFVRFQAQHSNECWQFDFSHSDFKFFKKGY